MTSKRVTLLVTAFILAGSLTTLTANCRAAETPSQADSESTPVGDTRADPGAQTVEGKYMGLSSGPLAQASIADLPGSVVVKSGDVEIRREEVDVFIDERATDPDAKAALQAEAFFVAEQIALEQLLKVEATEWAQDQDSSADEGLIDAQMKHIAQQITVSDENVRAFYDENRDMFQGAAYEAVKEQLRPMVLREKQQEAVNEHINGLSKRREVVVDVGFLAEVAPKAFDNPVDKARRSGKPTFVDFGAEGCYACDMMAPIIEELEAELGDQVNVVLIQVPEEQYLSARYGIRSIPMQFIYDADGRVVFDHVGFLSKEAILDELAALGVE